MKNKKRTASLICVFAALAVFTLSAIAAASNLSGYQRLKDVAFGIMDKLENATVELELRLVQDGVELASENSLTMTGGDKRYSLTRSATATQNPDPYEYYQDSERYISVLGDIYYESLYGANHFYMPDEGLTPAQRRFTEMFLDTLVGDVKTYVTYGGSNVSFRLSNRQIPELAQLALAVYAEVEKPEFVLSDGQTVYLGADAVISEIWIDAELGPDGISADAAGKLSLVSTVDGVSHTIDIYIGVKLYDVGTTTVSKPDLTGKKDGSDPTSFIPDDVINRD